MPTTPTTTPTTTMTDAPHNTTDTAHDPVTIGLVSVSDRASAGIYEDKGIPALQDWLGRALRNPITWVTRLIPDEQDGISATLRDLVDVQGCHLVLTTGGTGPALRDVTPEATLAVADKEMPGFGEQMRQISLRFVPTAILSRQVAVIRKQALVINLPGQPKSHCRDAEGLPEGHAAGARHLCRGALLHRPDRRAVSGHRRHGVQSVQAQERGPAAPRLNRPGRGGYFTSRLSRAASKTSLVWASCGTQSVPGSSRAPDESFSIACHSSVIWCSWLLALSIRPFMACDTGSSPLVTP
jgi:molybdopterin adenylyltransferase